MEQYAKLKLGIVGAGDFSAHFIPLFQAHPAVETVYITDLIPERAEAAQRRFGTPVMPSFEAMLDSKLDAVAIFTQRHLHGPMAIAALQAGKDVYSSVPMGNTVEECGAIIDAVRATRRIYMLGETCYYYPCTCFCRDMHTQGRFGRFIYGASQYYHDIVGFNYQHSGGQDWKRFAGLPPMLYPTHSFSMLLSAANDYVTRLSAVGYRDQEDDDIFGIGKNNWDNPFSNTTVLAQLAGGGAARISEYRRIGVGKPSSYISGFYGTWGSYEYSNAQHLFVERVDLSTEKVRLFDVSAEVNPAEMTDHKEDTNFKELVANAAWLSSSFAPVQPFQRLPKSFSRLPNGHMGTHQLLTNDFCRSVISRRLPPIHAWFAARCNIPGLVAHSSALCNGELMEVPDFGEPPADWDCLYR